MVWWSSPSQTRSPMMARKVEAKKARKAEARVRRRLSNRLNPLRGKPRNLPSSAPRDCAGRAMLSGDSLLSIEYSSMASNVQIDLWQAEKVATQTTVGQSTNGIRYAAWGETRVPDSELEQMVGAVPKGMSAA